MKQWKWKKCIQLASQVAHIEIAANRPRLDRAGEGDAESSLRSAVKGALPCEVMNAVPDAHEASACGFHIRRCLIEAIERGEFELNGRGPKGSAGAQRRGQIGRGI